MLNVIVLSVVMLRFVAPLFWLLVLKSLAISFITSPPEKRGRQISSYSVSRQKTEIGDTRYDLFII